MNITDVDDKTIRDSRKKKISLKKFTEHYENAFFEDLDKLNILKADIFPRATENIKEMIAITKKLLDRKYAYKGEDDCVYYKVSSFKDYGKLAHLDAQSLKAGASGRVNSDEYARDSVRDFALWKSWTKDDGKVFWETPLGKGRPGWHIECSAMSMKYLGSHFDIHTGGVDLVFPHHQNEIAQSEGATGKKFVNYWLHNEWLLADGVKMSKSIGNFYTLRDVLAKGYSPVSVRYLLLSTHYRQQLNFTFKGVEAAKAAVERLNETIRKLRSVKAQDENKKTLSTLKDEIESHAKAFEDAMDDDLNVSEALANIFDFVKTVNTSVDSGLMGKESAAESLKFLKKTDSVLGVMSFSKEEKLPNQLMRLIEKREQLRKEGKFTQSDKIRKKLREMGIQLDDTPKGVRWKKLK